MAIWPEFPDNEHLKNAFVKVLAGTTEAEWLNSQVDLTGRRLSFQVETNQQASRCGERRASYSCDGHGLMGTWLSWHTDGKPEEIQSIEH